MTGAFARELPGERPRTPDSSHGVPAEGGTFVPWPTCVERLRTADAYWLATTSGAGAPHVVPVWGVLVADDLYLETGASTTAKARNIERNPQVAVHLDGAGDALIVHGRAEQCRPDDALAATLAAAFAAKYPGYAPKPSDWEGGGLHLVVPRVMLAWRDMPSATRWRFEDRQGGQSTGGRESATGGTSHRS